MDNLHRAAVEIQKKKQAHCNLEKVICYFEMEIFLTNAQVKDKC